LLSSLLLLSLFVLCLSSRRDLRLLLTLTLTLSVSVLVLHAPLFVIPVGDLRLRLSLFALFVYHSRKGSVVAVVVGCPLFVIPQGSASALAVAFVFAVVLVLAVALEIERGFSLASKTAPRSASTLPKAGAKGEAEATKYCLCLFSPTHPNPVKPQTHQNPRQTRTFAWRTSYPPTAILDIEHKKAPTKSGLFH
jgi:hypothetical protein